MKQQTAVEYLFEKLWETPKDKLIWHSILKKAKEIEKEQQSAKWSWELMIYSLSKGDITKSDKIGALPLVYVFNVLGMKKELDI